MAEMSDKYKGVELFGGDGEKIGTVVGLLVDDHRQQYYVVERGGLLDIEATEAQFADLGWDRSPAEAEAAGD